MLLQLARRMLTETDPRLLLRFAWSFGVRGVRASRRFQAGLRRGDVFPPFIFISVTTACNLRCQGCWVSAEGGARHLDAETLDRIIRESKAHGSTFFGILGGEPLLHPDLFRVLRRHRDAYFQVFTNGTILTDEAVRAMRRLGNVTPLISIEGLEATSDARRGGRGVFRRALDGLERCRRHGLITGIATSVCRSNIAEVVGESFVRFAIRRGAQYLWYYIYRPVGPNPVPDLALSEDEILSVRRFMVEARKRAPILIVDAYWDAKGRALCPAAVGVSAHINPWGDIEPCPPIQFALDAVEGNGGLVDTIRGSAFLRAFRRFASETTRGCVLLERPDLLRAFLARIGARDTSGRGTGFDELAAMTPRPGHHMPGREIPESHWLYRFAKKHWFSGFGAYG
ncbi:MAG: radical SAM protein [Planctomycetes bacterium]|nr:radical SAM protein [Planctomycetota bacterium]